MTDPYREIRQNLLWMMLMLVIGIVGLVTCIVYAVVAQPQPKPAPTPSSTVGLAPARISISEQPLHAVREPRPQATAQAASRGRSAVSPKPKVHFSALELRIRACESGDLVSTYDYRMRNKHSSASGGWQFLRSTWNHYRGYSQAYLAPPYIQDLKAREVLDAQGTTPWAASRSCWAH